MPRGGKREGAGRKRGTVSEQTARRKEIIVKASAEGITPLEFMLKVLRDESKDFSDRYKAAVDAAPYMHPRLAATKVEGGDEPVKIETVVTWAGLSAGS